MKREVVVTGLGVLSPLAVDREEYWTALYEGRSGINYLETLSTVLPNRPIGGEVPDFRPKDFVRPKKNIKVMSKDIQMAFVSVILAARHAGLSFEENDRTVDPERVGAIFGCDLIGTELEELIDAIKVGIVDGKYDFSKWGPASMEKIMPLWMMKYLPNMPATHICISLDARGPSNSTTMERGSCLAALIEAAHIVERGDADVMICGSCGNKVNPTILSRAGSYDADPFAIESLHGPRPFDAKRSKTVLSQGAGAFILESKDFALARGAKPLAHILSTARTITPVKWQGTQKDSIVRALHLLLKDGNRTASDIDHLNADGIGTVRDDAIEAEAIHEVLGNVPVFAAKGHIGNMGSGCGAVELAASLLSLEKGMVPATKNCDIIADDCPVNVIHKEPKPVEKPAFIKINQTNFGRCFGVMMEKFA